MQKILDIVIELLMAGAGALGFALFFQVRFRNLLVGTLGGILGWGVYMLTFHFTENILLSFMYASFSVCIWSEIMARCMKAPVNVFMIPGLIPMVPGGGLYYTLLALINDDPELFAQKGQDTVLGIVGIAVGIVASSVVFVYVSHVMAKIAKRQKTKATKAAAVPSAKENP